MSNRVAFSLLFAAASLVSAEQRKPDFSGHWELDQARSGSRMETLTEDIDHHEPQLKIVTSWRSLPKDGEVQEQTGATNSVTIGAAEDTRPGPDGRKILYRYYWDGNKLIHAWRLQMDDQEIHGTVTRYMPDNHTQIVETYSSGSSVRQKMVLVKK